MTEIKEDDLILKWNKDNAENDIMYSFDLNDESVVFDVGGYIGDWSNEIYKRYKSKIFMFEPVKHFFDIANEKCGNTNINIYNYGIGGQDEDCIIYINKDGSSVFNRKEDLKTEEIQIRGILNVLEDLNILSIDLMKINCEGMEYDLLDSLIEAGKIPDIVTIFVQFHGFVENYEERKRNIETELHKTHNLVVDYELIWQKWTRKV